MKLKLAFIVLFISTALAFSNEAQKFSSSPQFSSTDMQILFEQDGNPIQLVILSQQEMRETEGVAAPLVAIGVMTGTRFIVQRYVTQKVARQMIQRGATNIVAPNRSVAQRIAGRGAIREFHAGSGARYTHFHPINRNGSHIWYGRPR